MLKTGMHRIMKIITQQNKDSQNYLQPPQSNQVKNNLRIK